MQDRRVGCKRCVREEEVAWYTYVWSINLPLLLTPSYQGIYLKLKLVTQNVQTRVATLFYGTNVSSVAKRKACLCQKRHRARSVSFSCTIVSFLDYESVLTTYRVRNFRGRVSNFHQSEARKQCFLASDWWKLRLFPENFVLIGQNMKIFNFGLE